MPREIITLQVGQCGNQIGWKFWAAALAEHAQSCTNGNFDEPMSTFFRNVDARSAGASSSLEASIPFTRDQAGRRFSRLASLRANAVLIDTEEGVVRQLQSSSIGELFAPQTRITDVSGAGNNWAHGFAVYGPAHEERLHDVLQTALEPCESPQGFAFLHSLGGGTGSGLGTFLMQACSDWYPALQRMSLPVLPSQHDDVVTSPYNTVLALNILHEHADVAFPMDNAALQSVVQQWAPRPAPQRSTAFAPQPPLQHKAPPPTARTRHSDFGIEGSDRRAAAASQRLASARCSQSTAAARLSMGKPATPSQRRRARGGSTQAKQRTQQGVLQATVAAPERTEEPPQVRASALRALQQRYRAAPAAQAAPKPKPQSQPPATAVSQPAPREGSAFDSMNALGAALVSNVTAPMRFHGQLNVDFSELCTNLVPFPALNLVSSSMAPFPARATRAGSSHGAASAEELFIAACSPRNALVSIPRSVSAAAHSVAVGFLARGEGFPVSTLESNIQRSVGLRAAKGYGTPNLWAPRAASAPIKLVQWNLDGVKSGLTDAPCAYAARAVTVLNNTTGVAAPLRRVRDDFRKLYHMKAHLHHYTDILSGDAIVGAGAMDTALESLSCTIDAYEGAQDLGT